MTIEQAEALLEDHESDYLKDGKGLMEGLKILEKYAPIEHTAADHDIIYFAGFDESITEEDVLKLNRLGFHLEEESWAYFT